MFGVIMLYGVCGRIILGPLFDPGANHCHFIVEQRRLAFGHFHLAILRRNHLENRAFLWLMGNNRRALVIATGEQPLEFGHDISAFGFGGLMTALAVGLQEG